MAFDRALVNFFYAHPVGHAVEALHYCLGHYAAVPEREIAVVLNAASPVVARLRSLLMPGRPFLYHHGETPARRRAIAEALAQLPLHGGIVVTTDILQERARARLLTYLLPRLEHMEHAGRVVLESRARSDKHDVRTRDRLRRSRSLSAKLWMDHETKTAELMTWVADFVVSSYMAAQHHGEQGPWSIISDAHVIEIVTKC